MAERQYNTLQKPLAFYPCIKFGLHTATNIQPLKFQNNDLEDNIPFITSQYFPVLNQCSELGQTGLDVSRNLISVTQSFRIEDYGVSQVNSSWNIAEDSDKTVVYSPRTSESNPLTMLSDDDNRGVKKFGALNDAGGSKIWRPFSPEPVTPYSDNSMKHSSRRETKDTVPKVGSSRIFPTILPSSVKLGESSVFKTVKKKKYQCQYCDQWYLNNGQLAGHIRAHIGSKPYRCEYPGCSRAFARNEELTRHRRIHSGVKPHQCDVCQKRFGRKDHLNKHKKTHMKASEKKIYLCDVPGCKHRYTRSDALTRHLSTAHSIKHQRSTSNSAGRSRQNFNAKYQEWSNAEKL